MNQISSVLQFSEHIIKDQAKIPGEKNYRLYSPHKDEENDLKIEMDLDKAIENNEFLLHYQPKVNLSTGKIAGMEALIRWNHPEWGIVPPNTFIPIAEETGQIIQIGKWALYEACSQNKRWQQQGFESIICVNLSARQFIQSDMVQTIAEVLYKTRLKPQFLEIEITESMLVDVEHTHSTLKELNYLGVQISIDDFGTGYSSLNYLKEFPVNTLKIDQSFVKELYKNPKGDTIVKTIISMAHNLSLNVVAEGIETKDQLIFLQEHLCNMGQGYFFSKPYTADEIKSKFQEIEQVVERNGTSKIFNSVFGNKNEVKQVAFVARDMTEKSGAEELLLKSEALSIVGELAAGVAHEIRNPITSIKGFIQLLNQGDINQEYLKIILSELNRVENTIKEFLSLAKPLPIQLKLVDVKKLIEEVEILIESQGNLKNVQIQYELTGNLPKVKCDANLIKQVLTNLLNNSIDASLQRGIIKVNICTNEKDLIITVIDYGVGISEERLQKLGEPFYSNKEKGIGMGLMVCFRIIKEHNGIIKIKSKENQGTTVEVRLPI